MFSVVTFNRFGVASAVRDELQSGGLLLGDIVSFSAFISLSIPEFKRKPWRWDQISCQLPVHLLDHIYDLMSFLGLPAIESVKADVKTEFLWGRSIDRSLAINLKLSNGAVGTITAVQHPQGKEFLMPLQKVSLIGTQGALEIQLDHARFIAWTVSSVEFL
ncbi:hypothetical protein AWV80_23390 [Cupriavidus sp. UYMU48A]|nr:hypothetical protein AWV80_23390 [Cupriavidus sp. UYMU48A]